MGADIHMYIEYTDFETEIYGKQMPYWSGFGGSINPGRNYWMFAVLADVRNYSGERQVFIEPRGLPEGHIGYKAEGDYHLYITDDPSLANSGEWCSRDNAERWIASGCSKPVLDKEGKLYKVTHPDWHSASWMTAAEFASALESYKEQTGEGYGIDYEAINGVLQFYAEKLGPDKARIVFWFDN